MREQNIFNLIHGNDRQAIAAILRKKVQQLEVTLPKNVVFSLAENLQSKARALELSLTRLAAHSSVAGTETTVAWTQGVLKTFIDAEAQRLAVYLHDNLHHNLPSQFSAKDAKPKRQDTAAADRDFVFCLMKAREAGSSRVKLRSEVNGRESERERLARRDAYERALERRAKWRNQA
jgi:chromosomal replication initiation ATPase DnaA